MLARLPQPLLLGFLALLLEAVFWGIRRQHPLDENIVPVVALGLAAGVIYLVAAFLVLAARSRSRAALVVILLAAVVFRATLLDLPPTLSDDFHRYQWEGRIQLEGHNPYLTVPADPELEALRPAVYDRLPGKDVPTPYAPLTELFFWLAAYLDGQAAFKLLSVAFDLGTLLLLVGLLHLRGLLIIRPRFAPVSIFALAAAVMSKWFAAVVLPVFFRRWRWWGGPLFAAAAFLFTLPYVGAGSGLLRGLITYAERWRNNASLYDVLLAATAQDVVATGIALGIVGGMAVRFAWLKTEPLRASFLLLAAVLLVSPSVFPWYVTWLVPFLCFFPDPALVLWTVTVLLSYHVLIDFTALGQWHYTTWLVWFEYVPVFALLLFRWLRPREEG
jgi:hypothetical protein